MRRVPRYASAVVRWASLVALLMIAMQAVTAAASAKGGVRATLTSSVPANKSGGDHVKITWRLRDTTGRPVSIKRILVRIVCPTGDSYTTTYARALANGLYRVVAVVPPGGIGTVSLSAMR
ncbi:MAG: hypothetical protein JWM06_1348 [Actinomycetia bacterium]|nr:hypothetical protein [Actinomycetes bacterium]